MIITRAPFRVSFCGGGSDLPSFYEKYGGCVLSTTIRKYMYLTIHNYFHKDRISLKYSKAEEVTEYNSIQHKYFRQCLSDFNINGAEITSMADIPAGTGLGSSSAFTVALLQLLHTYRGEYIDKYKLAKDACEVEIEKLGSPIGKQDQYAASYGGLNFIRFNQDGTVSVSPIMMQVETYKKLQKNLMMFYTGVTRSANRILSEQKKNITEDAKNENIKKMCALTEEMKMALESNDLSCFGKILDESWNLKRTLASGISSEEIDKTYEIAIESGAVGGKLLGAGGGGFLLFYCEPENQEKLRERIGLKEFEFQFEQDGTSVVYIGDKYWR